MMILLQASVQKGGKSGEMFSFQENATDRFERRKQNSIEMPSIFP